MVAFANDAMCLSASATATPMPCETPATIATLSSCGSSLTCFLLGIGDATRTATSITTKRWATYWKQSWAQRGLCRHENTTWTPEEAKILDEYTLIIEQCVEDAEQVIELTKNMGIWTSSQSLARLLL